MKEAQLQSYSPAGVNVPTWQDILAPPGEYDWIVHLRRCGLSQITYQLLLLHRIAHGLYVLYVDAVCC